MCMCRCAEVMASAEGKVVLRTVVLLSLLLVWCDVRRVVRGACCVLCEVWCVVCGVLCPLRGKLCVMRDV